MELQESIWWLSSDSHKFPHHNVDWGGWIDALFAWMGQCKAEKGMRQIGRKMFGVGVMLSIGTLGWGAYMPAKAMLAQHLLENSWQTMQSEGGISRPWPWADTWPVGKLSWPDQKIDQIILAGASGRTLAFAPGYLEGTSLPGEPGHIVISGHRDTHFRFLARLKVGDELTLQAVDGNLQQYTVTERAIINVETDEWRFDPTRNALTLLTCYPFDALAAGGPLRYRVTAETI